jgi:hypothetical protein
MATLLLFFYPHSSFQLHSPAQTIVVDCGVNEGTFRRLFSEGSALFLLWLDHCVTFSSPCDFFLISTFLVIVVL